METTNNYNYKDIQFEDLFYSIKRTHDIINVAERGLRMAEKMPDVIALLKKHQLEEIEESNYENAFRHAEVAKKEVEAGFPFLFTQSVLMMYSSLEASIKSTVITFFKNNDLENIKEVGNIKIVFAEFINLEEDEKYDYLFQQYEKNITSGILYGLTRFENLLSPIGLSGEIDSQLSKDIFELSQTRNNILHRGGIADRFFVKNCPWLNYKNGDCIKIDRELHEKYFSAIIKYCLKLAFRVAEIKGMDTSELKKEFEDII